MLNKNKTKIFSILISSFFLLSNAQANDSCNNLIGTWQGTAQVVQKFHVCRYKISLDTSKQGNTFILLGGIFEGLPNSFGRCESHTFMLTGTCEKGDLHLNDDTHGKVLGNLLQLHKYTEPKLGDATLYKVGP